MESLRLRNYRCFEDTGDIKLKPITLLVGANSSGKSSFLKFFPLLKQSIGIKKNGVFLWYSDDVDFKDFRNTVRDGENKITIDMEIDVSTNLARIKRLNKFFKLNEKTKVFLHFTISERFDNNDYLESLSIEYLDQTINVIFTKTGKATVSINNDKADVKTFIRSQFWGELLPNIVFSDDDINKFYFGLTGEKILNFYKENNIPEESPIGEVLFNPFCFISKEQMKEFLYKKVNETIDVDKINNTYILYHLEDIIDVINANIHSIAMNISYVKPLRVMPERYYRYQNYSVDEIASDGKNLAMYFANMTDDELQKFQEWTFNNFKFEVHPQKLEGHIEIDIKIKKEKERGGDEKKEEIKGRNMIDTGFGYNQLLPILAIIWNALNGQQQKYYSPYAKSNIKYIVIEQPELHLHPRILSMFAEMLCSIVSGSNRAGTDIRFIIETHSETIINKIGSLIMSKKINEDNVNVVLFNAKNEGLNNYVEQTAYDEKGYLNNWPIGFFL